MLEQAGPCVERSVAVEIVTIIVQGLTAVMVAYLAGSRIYRNRRERRLDQIERESRMLDFLNRPVSGPSGPSEH